MAEPKPISKVLLVFAMEAEAQPFLDKLGLKRDEPGLLAGPAPCVTYSGALGPLAVHLVWAGKCPSTMVDNVATVPASLAAYLGCLAFKPDLVISAGTAGGFKAQGAAIGDVFVGTAHLHHDRRIPLPDFDKYGLGYVAAPPTPKLQAALGLKPGVVSSGNSLDYTDKCMEIMRSHNAAVKEMEAASIAWVAGMYGTPFFSVKAITDIVDGDRATAEEFLENLNMAAAALQRTLPQVLDFVLGKTLEEL